MNAEQDKHNVMTEQETPRQGNHRENSLPAFLRITLAKLVAQHPDLFFAMFIALAALGLYLRTLAPDVVDADGGEFQFAAWNFSFVHPTGYPLFLILGGLFQHLAPFGNPAYRLNVFTAITGALAVALVYLAAHELTRHRAVAGIVAATFAVSRTLWYDASAAETYALNAGFIALLIYIALRWQAEPTPRKFAMFCFIYGLALTHHRTIILWLPAFALFFFLVARQAQLGFAAFRFLPSAVLFFSPLVLYLYIPLRAPTAPYATLTLAPGHALVLYDNSLIGAINYFLGRAFQSEIRWDAVSVARLMTVPQMLQDEFGGIGLALGLGGLAAMVWRKDWARLGLILTGGVMTVLFDSIYHIGDIFHYYIPIYLVWALWIGVAIGALARAIQSSKFELGFLLLAVIAVFVQLVTNFSFADRSGETQARAQWTRVLSAPLPPNALLISNDRDEMMSLWYMQYVENTRRDVVGLFPLITPAPEYTNIARLTDSVLEVGRPIYFSKPMPGLEIKYRVEQNDWAWRVLGRAMDAPPQFPSHATIADRVRVLGFDVARQGETLRVAIAWTPLTKLNANYSTFVHLLDLNGNKIAQGNDHQVGGDFYPTTLWRIGEILRDEHALPLPPNLASGTYRLRVGMYRQSDGEVLGEPVVIGEVQIANDK